VKSPAYLEAVLKRPFLATFGIKCYPYVADKIAILIHSMIATPVFEEVKNRTAMGLGLAVAKANGQRILPIDG